jgi:hypothetical protein
MDSESAFKDLLLCVSAFVLLRSADIEEGERRAIAEFDGQEYTPELPTDLSWPAILNLDLSNKDSQRMWAGLGSLPPSDLTMPLRRIAAVVDSALSRAPDVLTATRNLVDATWADASGRDVLASEFEAMLQRWLEQTRYSGEFATPSALADFMVELAAPRAGDRVYDPCFGLGGLLVGAARRIVREGMTLSPRDWNPQRSQSFFGIELRPEIALIAAARLALAGMPFARLEIGNSLERNGVGDQGNEGFDCILANPPFGFRVNEAASSRFRVRSTSGNVLFLQHILKSLRQGGRAVITVPESFLFRTGGEAKLREIMLNEYRVEAVLSLPVGAFAPYTGVKTSLLLISRQSPLKMVYFVGPGVTSRVLTDPEAVELRHGVARMVESRRAGQSPYYESDDKLLHRVDIKSRGFFVLEGGLGADGTVATCASESVEHLAKHNWELVVREPSETALDALVERVVEAIPSAEIRKLGDIAEVFAGVPYDKASLEDDSAKPSGEEALPFIRVQEVTRPLVRPSSEGSKGLPEVRLPTVKLVGPRVAKLREKQRLRVGDLLLTASGTVGKVAMVSEAVAGAVAAQSLIVIRPTGYMQPAMLLRLLQVATYQRWIDSQVTGAPIRHLSARALRSLPVVIFDSSMQRLLSRDLSEEAGDEAILELLSRPTGQSYWVTLLLNNATLAQLEKAKRPAETWSLVDRWISEFRELGPKLDKETEREPLANWLLWWTNSLARVRETKEIPDTMSRFAALQSWRNEFVHGNIAWLPPGSGKAHFLVRLMRDIEGSESGMLDTRAVGETFANWITSTSPTSVDDRLANITRDHLARLSPLPLVLAQNEMTEQLESVKFTATTKPSVLHAGSDQEITVSIRNESPLALQKVNVQIVERGLPHNFEAERSLLGGLLYDNSAIADVSGLLRPQDFAIDKHAMIYRAMLTIANAGRSLDLITLSQQLELDRQLEMIGGNAYVASLVDGWQRAIIDEAPVLIWRDSLEIAVPDHKPPIAIRQCARVIRDNARFRHGYVPLRATENTSILAPQNELSLPLHIPAGPPRQIALEISWSAERLNNTRISGAIEIGLEVRADHKSLQIADLGGSPYVVGPPIDRPDIFYGRADILGQVHRALRNVGPASVILLEGNRRSGKTSILKQLVTASDLPGWMGVYCSFQSAEGPKGSAEGKNALGTRVPTGVPTCEIFYSIARELLLAVHGIGCPCDVPGLGVIEPSMSKLALRQVLLTKLHPLFEGSAPFEQFQIILESAIDAIKPRRILLMLDEFDKLQEGIDSGVTSPQVPENIRYLFHTYSQLSGILTGSRRIKRLREEYWSALFGIGNVISVTALDEHAARSLVTNPVTGRLVFAPAAVDRVLFLTARQPFLIQSLCDKIFDHCAASGERNVTTASVDSAATVLVKDNEHFRTLWDYIRTDRRRFIVCLIDRLSSGPNKLTLGLIADKLAEEGIPYQDDLVVAKDVDELRELEIIELKQDELEPAYAIAVPLFSLWMHDAIDSNVCRLGALQEEAQ